ncbi:hypothetical protein C4K39_3556 [Pseudomonas sessilinigenes]|nr:hypothetical protein C4K39_3556 [Pseudomonas sessilinigenes]
MHFLEHSGVAGRAVDRSTLDNPHADQHPALGLFTGRYWQMQARSCRQAARINQNRRLS